MSFVQVADFDFACKVPPNIFDDTRHLTLNTVELLPNMCDNHQ